MSQEYSSSEIIDFFAAVRQGVEQALSIIEQRFEQSIKPEDNLDFHRREHTLDMSARVVKILESIQSVAPQLVSTREIDLAKLAAAWHDVVQKWQEERQVGKDGQEKIMRKRLVGDNEQASAQAALSFMQEVNLNCQVGKFFSEADRQLVQEAILVTVPGFDVKHNTVIQPNLKSEVSLVVRALALADLGTAGMDGGEQFVAEGKALFREENLDMAKALRENQELSLEQQENFRQRLLAWSAFQPKFAQGRQELLDQELAGLPKDVVVEVKKLFGKFDESISTAQAVAQRRKKMSFKELIKDFGY